MISSLLKKKVKRLFTFWENVESMEISIVYCTRVQSLVRQMWSIFRIKRLNSFQIFQWLQYVSRLKVTPHSDEFSQFSIFVAIGFLIIRVAQ